MMFFVSNIGAPPTFGLAKAGAASMARTRAKDVDFIGRLPVFGRRVCVPSDERTEGNGRKFQHFSNIEKNIWSRFEIGYAMTVSNEVKEIDNP